MRASGWFSGELIISSYKKNGLASSDIMLMLKIN
jgi:hypothetical protein